MLSAERARGTIVHDAVAVAQRAGLQRGER
jgi:hypothetical protein